MTKIQTFKFNNREMECHVIDGQPWFRGKDIATILEYANTVKAISNNVHEDDRKKLEEFNLPLDNTKRHFHYSLDYNAMQAIYINESGMYALIFGSKKLKLRYSNAGSAARSCHPSGSTAPTILRRRLSSCMAGLTMIKRRRYGEFATLEGRPNYITTW